jgi:hypothetical protein
MFSCLTWLNVVEPRVSVGLLNWGFEMTKGAEDEILAFLVKDQYSAEHGSCLCNLAELPGVKEVRRNCQHKDATPRSIGALEFVLADLHLPFNTSTSSLCSQAAASWRYGNDYARRTLYMILR